MTERARGKDFIGRKGLSRCGLSCGFALFISFFRLFQPFSRKPPLKNKKGRKNDVFRPLKEMTQDFLFRRRPAIPASPEPRRIMDIGSGTGVTSESSTTRSL